MVTGASSGLGKEIALTLAQNGFKVFAGVRKQADKEAIEALNSSIEAVFLDVTQEESVKSAFEQIKSKTESLYGLVNNAGIAVAGPVECLPVEAVKKQFEVNVFGAIRVAQRFLPMMDDGRIVNISSMASFGLFPFVSPYCASKIALDIFFNALLLECKKPGLKVISIKPGVVKTAIWDKSIDACTKILDNIPEEFHKKYGVSPGKYLRELRISQACRLLMTKSDHTLQEIAQMAGYSNNNYFGKVFKAEKGISPDKYRKQSSKYDLVRAIYETPHI